MFGTSLWLSMMLMLVVVWVVPVLLVAASNRGTGLERAIWALVCVCLSWLGYAAFRLSVRHSE
jgi:hypothetical protein